MPHSLLGLLLVFLFCPRADGQTSSLPLRPEDLMSPLPAVFTAAPAQQVLPRMQINQAWWGRDFRPRCSLEVKKKHLWRLKRARDAASPCQCAVSSAG